MNSINSRATPAPVQEHTLPANRQTKVWDKGIRVFHWALVVCIVGAWYTIEQRMMDWHRGFGYAIAALLIFRVIWGVVGSTTARFTDFVVKPSTAYGYLKDSLRLKSSTHNGHNPAGGWMVISFLVLLAFQVISGLYSNNEIGFNGAFSDSIPKALSDQFTQWHALSFDIITLAIWLHLVAVFFYVLVKRQNLIKALFSGKKPSEQANPTQTLRFFEKGRLWLCVCMAILPIIYLLWIYG
ncbi:cytochrome b/b6 domain-containing protein [Agaribacter marinus]|uniref:Hydrogenase n=1 Tax=Agaribacter marinus TaxID=1431249 RepID=A0AA37WI19_9ALTE|nr:cytochrome b/b6 domain-containing protein [Agaribacter marinus]GLR69274.1 hydrogenase [Agaribacter marinus]